MESKKDLVISVVCGGLRKASNTQGLVRSALKRVPAGVKL
jgi:hypothetical protein